MIVGVGTSELCRADQQAETQEEQMLQLSLEENSFLLGDLSLFSQCLQLLGHGPPTLWQVLCFIQSRLM